MSTKFDEAAFYNTLRNGKLLGPVLEPSEFAGVNAIVTAAKSANWPVSWLAYALATTYHETAHTMQPIKEIGNAKYFTRMYDPLGDRPQLSKSMGNTTPGDGIKYCGRGFVQLTWKTNYEKAGRLIGVPDLAIYPDKAMDIEIAGKILIGGMAGGWFSGKSLAHYLPKENKPATIVQFKAARRIINGVDKDQLIADYALRFQNALVACSW